MVLFKNFVIGGKHSFVEACPSLYSFLSTKYLLKQMGQKCIPLHKFKELLNSSKTRDGSSNANNVIATNYSVKMLM